MTTPELLPLDEHNLRLQANVSPIDYTNPEAKGRYHLVVIGAGTAGLVAAAGGAGLGARVALVERNLMGGDCLNVGCVPSKGIIAAARAAASVREAPRMGVHVPEGMTVDFTAAMDRMRRLRADISPNDSVERFTSLGIDVYQGQAEFADDKTVLVTGNAGERKLPFRRALLASGARAAAPPIRGLETIDYLTNETLFSLTELPESLAVIGGGPIGCEMAQAFARLGSRVTLFTDEHGLMPRDDAAAGPIIQQALEADGVVVQTDGKQIAISRAGEQGILVTGPHGETHAERLLVAVGRAPNVEGIGLDKVGVAYDPRRGVQVSDQLQTTNPRIFAAGDICSAAKFTHAADFQARTVVRNALMPWPMNRAKGSMLTIPWATYTSPEVAGVGLTEAEAEKRGIPVDTYTQPFADVDRAILEGETTGYAKVLTAEGTDRIVGATIVAPGAGDMIGELSLAMTHGVGLGKIASAIHPYPTMAEAIRKLGDHYNRTKLTPTAKWVFTKWFGISK